MLQSERLSRDEATSFIFYLSAILFSAVGRNGYTIACAWLLAASGSGMTAVAWFFGACSVMELIASPICGWICDKYDRRRLAVVADVLRCIAAICLGFFLRQDDHHLVILLSTILFASSDRLYLTATQSMIRCVGETYSASFANSAVFFFMQVGSLVAALLIGLILYLAPAILSLLAAASCFAVSAVCMAFVRPAGARHHQVCNHIATSVKIDAAFIRLSLIYCMLYMGGLLVSALGPTFVLEELSGNSLDFGRFETAWSIGSILGIIAILPLMRAVRMSALLHAAILASALFISVFTILDLPFLFVAICLFGAFYNLGRVVVEVCLQNAVPNVALGRAKGIMHSVAMAFGILVLGLIAILSDSVRPTTIFSIYASVLFVCGIVLALLPNRTAS